MRFARYECSGARSDGVLAPDGHLYPLAAGERTEALIAAGGRAALLAAGAAALDAAPGPAVADVRLLPPLHPASIRDSVSFEAHVEGARKSQEAPPTRCRPGGMRRRAFTSPTRTHASARSTTSSASLAASSSTWSWKSASYLVTADELARHRTADGFLDLTMRAFINGELLGEDSLANMAFTFEELISFASRGAAVAPGDLLASGTCQRGCLTEIWGRAGQRVPPPLAPGDVVTLEVEGLGTVRNKVIDPAPCPPVPAARRGQPRGPRH